MFYLPIASTGGFTIDVLLRVKNLPHAMTMLLMMITAMCVLRILSNRKLFVFTSAMMFMVRHLVFLQLKSVTF